MDSVKNCFHMTNIVRLYTYKYNFILFLNVCNVYEADIRDAQTDVRNFKDNLNVISCLFIMSFILIGYGIIFNLLLAEMVLILMRYSFECGKHYLINTRYVGIKPYTLISAWNL
jgi:hypothetical protein